MLTAQVPFQILAIVLHAYIFEEETIEFNVKRGNKREAIQVISKIYH